MSANPKVFCSHRRQDKPAVKAIAAQLAEAGIDPWLDEWEILPGAVFVAAINKGLETCQAGLIFFSNETKDGQWVQAEIAELTRQAIEEGKPLIPVMLDPDAPLPPLLKSRSRLGADQIPQLIDAIYGRTGKPPVTPPRAEVERHPFIIRLRKAAEAPQEIAVTAEAGGAAIAPEETVPLGPGFHYSYADFLHARPPGARQTTAAEQASARDRDLRHLGAAIGRVLFPEPVDRALTALLDRAAAANHQVHLTIETADPALLAIPFEAASLTQGRIPALEPGVVMSRRLTGCAATMPPPSPGPLKILVAVGAPDENKSPNTVLDYERELQTILDSTEDAARYGNAAVRILEVGSLVEIESALKQDTWHVLHLSGHGSAGSIELEDEDGAPQRTTAAQLAAAVHESGHPAPLIFLASCHSGAGNAETAGLAQQLLAAGVPAVVAMQSSVLDSYATELARAFYDGLSAGDRPLASVALAQARRKVESERRKAIATGAANPSQAIAEYATPSLFLASGEQPLLDRALPLAPLKTPARMPSPGVVPRLTADELVGRRRELRRLMRVLQDDPRTLREIGRKAGYQLTGMGGAGKSALAGRAITRMEQAGWLVAELSGQWTLSQLAETVGMALMGQPQLAEPAQALMSPSTDDRVRTGLLGAILAQLPLLLVLDNFEDNLAVGGQAWLDPATGQLMEHLWGAARKGKLLITSRYPVPEAEDWLATEQLGPLSAAETRKLCRRLPALNRQTPEDLQIVYRAVGGHPRALEYLNAILNRGQARMPDVKKRLREKARELGLDLNDTGLTLEQAVRRTLEVAARDILVNELLELVAPDQDVLFQVSVFPMPVPEQAVASCLGMDRASAVRALERLGQSSLVTRLEEDHVWVHRWTAGSLRERMEEQKLRECCRSGGEYLNARARESKAMSDYQAAVRLFLTAEEWDRAVEIAEEILGYLKRFGRATDTAMLARELAEGLPPAHERHFYFLATEADALLLLGLTGEAVERWRSVLNTLETHSREHPDRADCLRDLSVSYERMGDLMRGLGEGEQARQFYQKSLELRERLVRQEPDRADYLRDLSISYERMGDLMGGLGEGEQARQFYQKSLENWERLVRQEPDRADYQRGLCVPYERMGDLMRGLGEGEQARQFYQKDLEIAERLVRQEPDRADYLRDLSVSYERMGDLMRGLGEGEQARQFYQKALEIAERLVRQEPDRADYLRDLSVSYNKMGDLMRGLGEGEQARQFYQKSLELRERLVRQEPDRADYLRDLSVSYNKMGDLMRGLGEGEQARQFYQKALEIAERLVRQEPDRADYLRDLSVSYNKMGDLMRGLGEGEQARQFYQKALEIAERLVRQEPDRADYLRDLSVSYERMGDLMSGLGEGEQARQFYQKALEIAERLVRQEPDRADYLRDLSVSYERMGDLMRGLGEGEQARQFYQKSLENWERLVRQEPDRADYQRGLCVPYERMGDLMRGLGEGEQARQFYQKLVDNAERLVRQEPDRADYLRDLSVSYERMGDLMRGLGEGEQARQFYQKSLENWERLVRQEPDRADYQRGLCVPYERMGDLMRGLGEGEQARQFYQKLVDNAERLVRQEPDRADYLRDLSVSYERMGDLMRGLGEGEQARQFYQKSLENWERLVRQEPDRADHQTGMIVPLSRIGTPEALERALEIARRLERKHKLTAQQSGWIQDLENALQASLQARKAAAGSEGSPE